MKIALALTAIMLGLAGASPAAAQDAQSIFDEVENMCDTPSDYCYRSTWSSSDDGAGNVTHDHREEKWVDGVRVSDPERTQSELPGFLDWDYGEAKQAGGTAEAADPVPPSDTDPARLYAGHKKACRYGDGAACHMAGDLQANGALGEINLPLARVHYDSGCRSRHATSCFALGGLYEKGFGTGPDREQAAHFYRKALDYDPDYTKARQALARLNAAQ